MPIRIGIKKRPFSKDPGAKCVLPNSPYRATFYPTKIVCAAIEIPLSHSGPVQGFTVQQDLEKGFVRIFGEAREGRVAYRFFHKGNHLVLYDEKQKKLSKTAVIQPAFEQKKRPRLSFGCHKKQDVYQILHRLQPMEYLPLLYEIGNGYPQEEIPENGIGKILKEIGTAIERKNKVEIIPAFTRFVMVGLESIFSPVLHDAYHMGVIQGHLNVSPHIVLAQLAGYIEQMLFVEKEGGVHLLPALPPELPHGKLIGIPFSLGTIDIEWTKKKLRCVQLTIEKSGRFELVLPKQIQSFRIHRGKEKEHSIVLREDILSLEEGHIYTLDRFQK